ncbi:MAG: hypothetical protein QGH66_02220 [Dehalococcoidia bacterium]|jgi:hypothetical protein|nr:hypothetical protein [Dehalococcoidia bacterium]MDP7239845.1 hypothetical protein [Dehalococcoidia bacterium]
MGALLPVLTPAMMLNSIVALGISIALTLKLRQGTLGLLRSTTWSWAAALSLILTVTAMVIGFTIMVPTDARLRKLRQSVEGHPPIPEEAQQLGQLSHRIKKMSQTDFVLILIAMAATQYL